MTSFIQVLFFPSIVIEAVRGFRLVGLIAIAATVFTTVLSAQSVVDDRTDSKTLIDRLSKTKLINGNVIHERLELAGTKSPKAFYTANPYQPRYRESFNRVEDLENRLPQNKLSYRLDEAKYQFTFFGQKPVLEWYRSFATNTQVCAVRFTDARREEYELQTFENSNEAIAADCIVTHRSHCGTCSSLRSLAVYMAKPDLTTPARSCVRKLTLWGIKSCLMETIGFDERCAETWAYNIAHTKQRCMATCVRHYGLWNVLRNNMGDRHVDENGELNPCLACDEFTSGPGFQYAAGRTRRASGLSSAIEREADQIYPVDHSLYFE